MWDGGERTLPTKHFALAVLVTTSLAAASPALAQQTPAPASSAFDAGPTLGVTTHGKTTPISFNVKVYGSVVSAESCVHDPARKRILKINRGASQKEVPNDAWVSLHKPNGSLNTPRWIGVNRNGLTLNQPFGSTIQNGKLYVSAYSDGDTADGTKLVNSVTLCGVSRTKPRRQAELVASGFPGAASACYDTGAKQLVIPMNQHNALAFVKVK